MSTHLITDSGELRAANCQRLRRELNCAGADFDFVAYVVRNLGFVAFRQIGSAYRLWLRPAKVSQIALAGLFQLLADERPERVVFTGSESDDLDTVLGPWARAMQALNAQVSATQDPVGDAFLRVTRDLDKLRTRDPLAGFFGRWRERGGRVELDEVAALIGRSLGPRHIVMEPRPLDGALATRSVGRGFVTYNAAWHARARDQGIGYHRDYRYSKWVNDVYRQALVQHAPILDDLDVLVGRPEGGRQRVRYRRLIVPIQGRDGTHRLLGASVLDDSIDLRLKA